MLILIINVGSPNCHITMCKSNANYWTIWRNHLTLNATRSTSNVKRPLHRPVLDYCYYYHPFYHLYARYLQLCT